MPPLHLPGKSQLFLDPSFCTHERVSIDSVSFTEPRVHSCLVWQTGSVGPWPNFCPILACSSTDRSEGKERESFVTHNYSLNWAHICVQNASQELPRNGYDSDHSRRTGVWVHIVPTLVVVTCFQAYFFNYCNFSKFLQICFRKFIKSSTITSHVA